MRIGTVLILVAIAPGALAWEGKGHEQIADIAWVKLNPKAKRAVARMLLAGDPKFRPEAPRDETLTDRYLESQVRPAFRRAAVWPDVIKGDTSEQYEAWINDLNAKSPGVRPTADPFQRGTEENRLKTWHYLDVPLFYTGAGQAPPPRPSNADYALRQVERGLRDSVRKKDDRAGAFWIYWANHVIGDIHQPLHCAEHFGPEFLPGGDDGGNGFQIRTTRDGNPTRLHGYWDGGIRRAIETDGEPGPEAITEKWLRETSVNPREATSIRWMDVIRRGSELARDEVYRGLTQGAVVPPDYRTRMEVLSRRMAVLGGIRLATFLNRELGK
ncbi:MAG: S1/P1 nuclease [Fimbriimonadaceae bacterium]|nr:S1/P1 nuclease [Fimbriimonadaceae bacterium]